MSRGNPVRPTKEQRINYLLDRVYRKLEDLEKAFDDLNAERNNLKNYLSEVYEQNRKLHEQRD